MSNWPIPTWNSNNTDFLSDNNIDCNYVRFNVIIDWPSGGWQLNPPVCIYHQKQQENKVFQISLPQTAPSQNLTLWSHFNWNTKKVNFVVTWKLVDVVGVDIVVVDIVVVGHCSIRHDCLHTHKEIGSSNDNATCCSFIPFWSKYSVEKSKKNVWKNLQRIEKTFLKLQFIFYSVCFFFILFHQQNVKLNMKNFLFLSLGKGEKI